MADRDLPFPVASPTDFFFDTMPGNARWQGVIIAGCAWAVVAKVNSEKSYQCDIRVLNIGPRSLAWVLSRLARCD
jgi:hypothetical protein